MAWTLPFRTRPRPVIMRVPTQTRPGLLVEEKPAKTLGVILSPKNGKSNGKEMGNEMEPGGI